MTSTRPKKIAVIENSLLATTTIRAALMKQLIQEGHEVRVFTSAAQARHLVESMGATVHDLRSNAQTPQDIVVYLKRLHDGLKTFAPDHCLTFTIRPAIWGNLVARKLRIPTLTSITGIGPLFESKATAYRVARALYPIALKHPQKVFFQNEDDKTLFLDKKFVTPEQAILIPGSGVDTQKFSPQVSFREHEAQVVFLMISRLIKDKGVLEYVEAARRCKKRGIKARFQLLGPFWTQNLASLSITPSDVEGWVHEGIIEYLGETQDVRPSIAAADVVVVASYREGTSNVLLEASSMAKPCIATRTTGCKEVVDDGTTGLHCNVKDAEDLARCMQQMVDFDSSARDQMGKRGREKMKREYEKSMVIDAYLKAISA